MADVLSTIGPGQDFTSLQLWADDIGTNGRGLYDGGPHTAVASVVEDVVNSSTWVCDFPAAAAAMSGARVQPAAGSAHGGVVGGGITITQEVANYPAFSMSAADYDTEIVDLDILLGPSAGASFEASCISGSAVSQEVLVKRCILRSNRYGTASGIPFGAKQGSSGVMRVVRCLIFDIYNTTAGGGYAANNCTTIWASSIYNCDLGPSGTSFSKDARNCISMDNATADFQDGNAGTTDRNMSSDATAPGATNYRGEVSTNIWTDPAAGDFTLLGGTNAIGNGEDLGTAYDANIDITGATVSGAWNLGAYQGAAQTSGAYIPFMQQIGF